MISKLILISSDIGNMEIGSDISSVAAQVSYDKLYETYESTSMSALKESIEAQAMIQEQLNSMLMSVMPHIGQNINTLV